MDKHIRRLDSDLSRFEQELKLKEPGMRTASISSIAEMAPPTLPSSESAQCVLIMRNLCENLNLECCSNYRKVCEILKCSNLGKLRNILNVWYIL